MEKRTDNEMDTGLLQELIGITEDRGPNQLLISFLGFCYPA